MELLKVKTLRIMDSRLWIKLMDLEKKRVPALRSIIKRWVSATKLFNYQFDKQLCYFQHIKSNQRGSTSGLSFLKWFKKTEKSSVDSRCSTKSIDRNFHRPKHHRNNSHDTLSPSSSPNLEYLSPSSSCDSIDSTSTTGFAFIKPNNYRPPNDIAVSRAYINEVCMYYQIVSVINIVVDFSAKDIFHSRVRWNYFMQNS